MSWASRSKHSARWMRLVRRQAGKAARAARMASADSAAVALGNVPMVSSVLAGLVLAKSPRGDCHSPETSARPGISGIGDMETSLKRRCILRQKERPLGNNCTDLTAAEFIRVLSGAGD